VDRRGIEPRPEACKATVLPLSLSAHKSLAPGVGIEPTIAESKSVVLPLHYPGINLVQPPGIEPGSMALQTTAMTTSAKVALLAYPLGLEPRLTVLETAMLPLHYGYLIWWKAEESNPTRLFIRT
jgi:hypothetical protein